MIIEFFPNGLRPNKKTGATIAHFWPETLENAMKLQENIDDLLKEVRMGPFGLRFGEDGSDRLWEASGMPPGP